LTTTLLYCFFTDSFLLLYCFFTDVCFLLLYCFFTDSFFILYCFCTDSFLLLYCDFTATDSDLSTANFANTAAVCPKWAGYREATLGEVHDIYIYIYIHIHICIFSQSHSRRGSRNSQTNVKLNPPQRWF
jgi:hypothetical protein